MVDKGKWYWQCKLCRTNPKRYADGSTKHPIEYLKGHRMSESGPIMATIAIQQAFVTSSTRIQFNLDVFKQLLTQWIITSNTSFHQVEDPTFRSLLSYLAAVNATYTAIPQCLPPSGNTIRNWIMQTFLEQKQVLTQELMNTHTVHFSFDLWTSSNHLALLGM